VSHRKPNYHNFFPKKPPPKSPPKPEGKDLLHILDEFSPASIQHSKRKIELLLQYHWDFYCDLVIKRAKVLPEIKESLAAAAIKGFPFDHWQRVTKYKWSLSPLSSCGSLNCPGGRFNIGDIDTTRFPPFPALYISSDRDTCIQEMFGPPLNGPLTPFEFALTNPNSLSSISMSGSLESAIDLRDKHSLKGFVDILKKFDIPDDLMQDARELNIADPQLLTTVDQLINALLDPNWRLSPIQLDIPGPPQIFGQLVREAGVDGIIYPSKYTSKPCLALFPHNFEKSESYVQLDDTPPLDTIIRRLDASNWQTTI